MKKFGENLRKLRDRHDMTQEALGKLLNVTQSTIAYYESGKKQPTLETLIIIADYFEVSTDFLLNRTNRVSTASEISKTDIELLNKINKLSDENRKEIQSYINYKGTQKE